MDERTYKQIEQEVEPFKVDGKITLASELAWMQFRGAVVVYKKGSDNNFGIIKGKEKQFEELSKLISTFYWMKGKKKAALMGTIKDEGIQTNTISK